MTSSFHIVVVKTLTESFTKFAFAVATGKQFPKLHNTENTKMKIVSCHDVTTECVTSLR